MKKVLVLVLVAVVFALTLSLTGCEPAGLREFNISFVANGEVIATVKESDTENLWPVPQRGGYAFEGWYFDEGVWDEPFHPAPLPFAKAMTEDTSVYAKWSEPLFVVENGDITSVTERGARETKLTFPAEIDGAPITKIANQAFRQNETLTQIVIDGVPEIGSATFSRCKGLTSIEIKDGVKKIGKSAFSSCSKVTAITVPDSVTTIGSSAFYLCNALNKIVIGNGVTTIGESAIRSCVGLKEVVIGTSVKSIGASVLEDAVNLEKVTIPYVGENADGSGATHLGYLFGVADHTEHGDLRVPSTLTTVEVTNTKAVPDYAFHGCKNLTSVKLNDGLERIGNCAFDECEKLARITLPHSVTTGGFSAFAKCTGLTQIALGSGLTDLGQYAFYGCTGLDVVHLPASLTRIGKSAFKGCTALTGVTLINAEGWSAGDAPMDVTSAQNRALMAELLTGEYVTKELTRG